MTAGQSNVTRQFSFTIPETKFTRAVLVSTGRRVTDGKRSLCIVAYSMTVAGFAMLMLTAWRQPANGKFWGAVIHPSRG